MGLFDAYERASGERQRIVDLLLGSYEGEVDTMTPLGLHHIMWPGHHYGPAPWWERDVRPDWNSTYYHRADKRGLGFDRTETGSNAVHCYNTPLREQFADLTICPERYLLWFHHVRWDHKMQSGLTLWDELALHYQLGVNWVRDARTRWDGLSGVIDPERHAAVAAKLAIQERDAIWWRDSVLLYFQTFSGLPLPDGVEKPEKVLEEYKSKSLLQQEIPAAKVNR